jgi:FkbM family methyltransferase
MKDGSQEGTLASDGTKGAEFVPQVFWAPDGLKIFHHSPAETKYVYHEIFGEGVYFRHGIDLARGESVLDIGANIGLFTMFVQERFEGIKVYAFEPSPVIYGILRANVARYGDSVSTYACGISGCPGEATFTFYPNYSIMSGFHTQGGQDQAVLRAGIRSHLREQGTDPAEITDRLLDRMVKIALGQKQEYACKLRTISDIIDEAGIQVVGLLKIDAEGSELDILQGIKDGHWHRIRQIVMEIHDPRGTACPLAKQVLEGQGYKCVFEQEKRLSGSGIVNCYARRG